MRCVRICRSRQGPPFLWLRSWFLRSTPFSLHYTHVTHGIQLRQCEAEHCGQLSRLRCFGDNRSVVLGDALFDLLFGTLACSLAVESVVSARRCVCVYCYGMLWKSCDGLRIIRSMNQELRYIVGPRHRAKHPCDEKCCCGIGRDTCGSR
jgi:hypothetical protein